MEQSSDTIIDLKGNALPGVAIRVFADDGSLAQLFSDNGLTPVSNPTYTDQNGRYVFYAANGRYTTRIEPPDGTEYDGREVVLFDPADNGAASIEFLQNGIGAVPRDLVDELRETIKITQFGAIGDGFFDCTDAINYALLSAAGKRLEIPAGGVYMTRGNHSVPRNTVMAGEGLVRLMDGSNPPHIFKCGDESAVTTVQWIGVRIDGNKANNTSGHGIHTIRPYKSHIDKIDVRNCAGDNVRYEATGSAFESYIRNSTIYGADGLNFRMQGNITDTHLVNCDIGYSLATSVQLGTSCYAVGCTIWGAGRPTSVAIYTAGVNWAVKDCLFEGHGQHGIVVSPGNHFGFISGNRFYANSWSASTTGQYDHIYISAGADFGTITGNKVYSSITESNQFVARYAINFAGAHESWTIAANDLQCNGVKGALSTARIVNGLLETDRFDGNWIRTSIKARRSATVAAGAAGAWTAFPYDQEDLDPIAEFSNGTFTPKNSGRYRIEAAFTCTPAAAGENLGLALYTNAGVGMRRLAFFRAEGTNSEMVSGSLDEFLTAGVAYDIRYLVGSTTTQFLAGPELTYLRIRAVPN